MKYFMQILCLISLIKISKWKLFAIFIFSYDFLYIYDGDSIFADLLLTATGDEMPNVIVSSGPEILILFQSDYSETEEGFKLEYRASKFAAQKLHKKIYLYLMFMK